MLYSSKRSIQLTLFFTNIRKLLVDNGWAPTGQIGTYSLRKNEEMVTVLSVHEDEKIIYYVMLLCYYVHIIYRIEDTTLCIFILKLKY